mgnify:CR=1 FL=1
MKKTSVILALAAMVVLMPAASSCSDKDSELKVISYNIRLGVADDGDNSWELRKEASVAMIEEQQPDIFGLQEAYDFQVGYLEEQCPQYGAIGVGRDDGDSEGEHMEIFYNKDKFNLKDWGTYWLSETPDKVSFGWDAACRRTATWGIFSHKESKRKFFYINTHLDHKGTTARTEGLKLIVSKIAELNTEGLPVILTGDFNVQPTDACVEVLRSTLQDARVAAPVTDSDNTYNAWTAKGKRIIDFIWFSGFDSIQYYRTLREAYGGIALISDHYPICAGLVLKN